MTTATLSADLQIADALTKLKRAHEPESLSAADLASLKRCYDTLRTMVARVRNVGLSEGRVSGWGSLAPGDAAPSGAADGLWEVLDGLLENEDPASLDPKALRSAMDRVNNTTQRASAVFNSRQPNTIAPHPLSGWTDDSDQIFRPY